MKKFMLFAAAILAVSSISLSSCSKNPVDKIVDIYESAASKVEHAESFDEVRDIMIDAREKVEKIESENKDRELTHEERQKIQDAFGKCRDAEYKARKNF